MDELIAFLTARLDEDEASEWPHRPSCQMLKRPPTGFPFANYSCNCDAASRWFFDVAAKRAIIRAIASELEDDPTDETARWMAATLAVPYAAHADYREEWHPIE